MDSLAQSVGNRRYSLSNEDSPTCRKEQCKPSLSIILPLYKRMTTLPSPNQQELDQNELFEWGRHNQTYHILEQRRSSNQPETQHPSSNEVCLWATDLSTDKPSDKSPASLHLHSDHQLQILEPTQIISDESIQTALHLPPPSVSPSPQCILLSDPGRALLE